jgi:hypothetical protein
MIFLKNCIMLVFSKFCNIEMEIKEVAIVARSALGRKFSLLGSGRKMRQILFSFSILYNLIFSKKAGE